MRKLKKVALGCKVVTFELLWWMEGIGLPFNADKRLEEPRDIWQDAKGGGHSWFSAGSSAWKWEAMRGIPHFVVCLWLPLAQRASERGLSFRGRTQSLSHATAGVRHLVGQDWWHMEGRRGWGVGRWGGPTSIQVRALVNAICWSISGTRGGTLGLCWQRPFKKPPTLFISLDTLMRAHTPRPHEVNPLESWTPHLKLDSITSADFPAL